MSDTNELKRCAATVTRCGQPVSKTEFVDWFPNDEEARAGYREIMEDQGAKVVRVEIAEGRATVEIA